MINSKNKRTVYRLEDSGVFKEVAFKSLKADDMFKMYEPSGELVTDEKGRSIFKCSADSYINDDGFGEVKIVGDLND